jgi:hypothetical protein
MKQTKPERVEASQPNEPLEFALVFATRQTEVDSLARLLAKVGQGDAIVWVAYPKGGRAHG